MNFLNKKSSVSSVEENEEKQKKELELFEREEKLRIKEELFNTKEENFAKIKDLNKRCTSDTYEYEHEFHSKKEERQTRRATQRCRCEI